MSQRCEAPCGDRTQMPQTCNANLHRADSTHGLDCKYSTVLTTPWRIVNFGRHPSARILAVSRKMNGLSPLQPRSPPEYSSAGCTFNALQIHSIDSLTSQ